MKKTLAGLACVALLSACSPTVPAVQAFPPTGQELVASAAHWQAIAEDLAGAIAPASGQRATIFRPVPATAFSSAFGEMLATALTERRVAVTNGYQGPAAARVRFEAQVVRSGLAAPVGLVALSDGRGHLTWVKAPSGISLPASPPPAGPMAEIVVTGAVERGGVDVVRVTRVYYVASGEVADYLPPPPLVVLAPPRTIVPTPAASRALPPAGRMLVIDRYGEKTVLVGQR